MSVITAEINMEEMDEWFRIGQEEGRRQFEPTIVASSTLGGQLFDPATGGPLDLTKRQDASIRLPSYRRNTSRQPGHQYADEYLQKEQQELLSQAATSDIVESVSGELERLELDSTLHGGSAAVADDLIPENATDVYKNYKFPHSYTQLPVLEAHDTIVSTIEGNQVTIIQGPTGSGKTTQVPQFILDYYAGESRYCNIVVTQPRKIAAVSIAQRVCDERGWELGTICGYQYGLERKKTEDTRLLYCTTGVLKEKFINKKSMHEYTHVILDEVHERDIESDFLLLIVKKLLRTNSSHVKVVLMSATFDTAIFSQYFRLPVGDHLELAPVVTIGTSHHHVSEFFADELTSRLGEVPPIDESRPGISPAMYTMAVGLIKEFDLFEEKEQGKDSQTGFAPVRGTVLMFLPGLHEIMKMQTELGPLEKSHFLDVIPLHSTITLEEQNKAFKKPTRGYRKVIVSTNIAESSITVPDIKYVIDFCLTKNLCCDPETNYPKLMIEWASKANTKQRKGRAGRVSNGRVYYMVPQWFYTTVLPEYGTPEMQRSPLDSLVLKAKLFDMGEPKALLGLALSPPDLDDIGRTILSLKEVGALSSAVGEESNPYDGTLTFLGRVLAGLPVDIRIGKLLVLGHVFGVLEECLIIGAALSVKSFFANPLTARFEAFTAKFEWSGTSLSDCIAALHAYKVWENRVRMKEFERAGATESQWGRANFLQPKRMAEVHHMVVDLEERLKRFNIVQPRHKPRFKEIYTSATEKLILKIVLCGAFYPNYAIKEDTDEKEAVKLLSGNDPCRTVMVKGLPLNQGILYVKQLQDIFRRIQRDPPVRVSCEQTRAFIEFTWRPNKNDDKTHPDEGKKEADKKRHGKIVPYVCLAIKHRQLGMPMVLNLYDKEETQRRLAELQKTAQNQRPDGNLRTNRLKAEDDRTDQQLSSSIIDPDITTLLISVTEVIECGHFWAHCDEPRTANALMLIHSTLNNARKPLLPLQHSIQPGHLVAAPYTDSIFYRARVEDVRLSSIQVAGVAKTTLVASVFFLDYGNTDKVPVYDLRALPPECQHLPFLAVEFYLSGLRPSSIKCADGVWSDEAKNLFRSWILNKSLIAQVYSIVDNTVRVELVYKFPNGQEICLNEKLIQQGFADKAEESFRSQQNHEQRINQRSTGIQTDKSESWLNVSMSSLDSSHAKGKSRGRKVNLSGPLNPLEMTFASLTLSGRHKVVKIDPESVNSVAVDDDPQNKFSRLLVAGCISMNPAGNSMIARDTTIMPQIPGLPALVTLLFAPYTEYRTDPKRERYTGALCGLGYDEEGLSHLPDHDIELEFETTFDTEDIVMINEVRMAINLAVGTEDTMANWGEDIFIKIQDGARQKLLALLKKSREPVVPKGFIKLYEWNQLDPDTILRYRLADSDVETPPLLRLHQAVSLVSTSHQPAAPGRRTTEHYLEHLKYLEKVVQSHQREPVRCELCKVTLANSHILAIHMQTERHLRQVSQLQEGKHH